MVPRESTALEVSFEWSHHRISSTDSEVRITLMSPELTLGVKATDKRKWTESF